MCSHHSPERNDAIEIEKAHSRSGCGSTRHRVEHKRAGSRETVKPMVRPAAPKPGTLPLPATSSILGAWRKCGIIPGLLLSLASGNSLFAHDAGLSTATIQIVNGRIDATVVMSIKDASELTSAGTSQQLTQGSTKDGPSPKTLAGDILLFKTDGQAVRATAMDHFEDTAGNATFRLKTSLPNFTKLEIHSPLLSALPSGHRQFISVRDVNGKVVTEQLLSASSGIVTITSEAVRANSPAMHSGYPAPGFLLLGVKHILMGFDHLLFLFCLLIVTRTFASALKIITSFTLAHSITLALAAFGTIDLPGRIVEPLIAASIIYVAIENLWRGENAKGRLWITFGFGLIHGLGFASVLRELGVGSTSTGVMWPLLSFNLGVELGQLLIAAAVLPILWKLAERPHIAKRWVPACSTLVALAGLYWLIERTCFS